MSAWSFSVWSLNVLPVCGLFLQQYKNKTVRLIGLSKIACGHGCLLCALPWRPVQDVPLADDRRKACFYATLAEIFGCF